MKGFASFCESSSKKKHLCSVRNSFNHSECLCVLAGGSAPPDTPGRIQAMFMFLFFIYHFSSCNHAKKLDLAEAIFWSDRELLGGSGCRDTANNISNH